MLPRLIKSNAKVAYSRFIARIGAPQVIAVWLCFGSAAFAADTEYQVVRSFHIADEPACMPAVTRAPNNDILVAFSTEWEPVPEGGVLKLVTSADRGQTWSQPRLLWEHEDPRVTIQVSCGMQTLSNGDIILPVNCGRWHRKHDAAPDETDLATIYDIRPDNPEYLREVRFLRSSDSGKTWTKEDPRVGKSWPRYGRLLETSDGRLIMTGYGWYVESRDFGRSWGPVLWVENGIKSEMNMVEAADGSLFTVLRGGGGPPKRVFGSRRSTDGGKTWSEERLSLGVQGKMPDLMVLPSGRILLVAGAVGLQDGNEHKTQTDRFSFCSLFISDDHGITWKRDVDFQQVVPQGDIVPVDQPGFCQLPDGKIFVALQAMDRSQAGDQWYSFHTGMSIIGNIIEPGTAQE
jgi:hypothetical protein